MFASAPASKSNRHFLPWCLLLVGIIPAVNCFAQTVRSQPNPQTTTSPASITFRLQDHPNAKSVALAGTFNNWDIQSTPMSRKGADWSVTIKLPPGTYQYKFVVDKNRWTVDPQNSKTKDDGEGHMNSVLDVVVDNHAAYLNVRTFLLEKTSFHRRLDVGGYKLYINCEGRMRKGVPVVVMDAGMGNSSESWLGIQPKIAEFARVCIYDRAGLGNSDPSLHTQTITQIVLDLHNLLSRAGVSGPLVVVGHSLGGINVREYARRYPKAVVGMVLVDSAHEDQFARMDALIPEEIKKQFPPEAFEVTSPEKIDFKENSDRKARLAKWHANIPLIVLTAANAQPGGEGPLAYLAPKFEEIRQELQQDLVHRSAKGKQIVATRSGHFIHHDYPELVISAVREVIKITRKKNAATATKQ
ncbi:MAG TPA: alpha/beta fold hydrolase [Pyrinomonadaceae bacterium]|nr:alpha/beta fold hydrolase [Pyrinomonadaceae bacterium]